MKAIWHDLLIGATASLVTAVAMILLQSSFPEARAERPSADMGLEKNGTSYSSVYFETHYVPRLGRNVTIAIYGDDMEVVE